MRIKKYKDWYILDIEASRGYLERTKASGYHQEYFTDYIIQKYFKNSNTRTCIDIGANYGQITYPISAHFNKVHSFEIDPDVFICFCCNTKELNNVIRYNIGLGAISHEAFLYLDDSNSSGLSSLIHETNNKKYCKVTTLDSFNIEEVDLIKIDIEGYEYQALQGSIKTITNNKPLLIVEIHHSYNSYYENRQRIFKLLQELNYIIADVRHNDFVFIHESNL